MFLETYFGFLKPRPGTNAHRVWTKMRPYARRLWLKGQHFSYQLSRPVDRIRYSRSRAESLKSRERFANMTEKERAELLRALKTPSLPGTGAIISMVGASRKINNPNNRLEGLLRSVIQKTCDLSRVEMILRIDEDDDLFFYREIQKTFGGRVNLHFVIGGRKGGYLGLHRLVAETLDHLAPSSLIAFGVADDCTMWRQDWDEEFIKIMAHYPDNIFFINTRHDFRLNYENDNMFFWMLWTCGPPSPFAAVGRKVLKITAEIAKQYEDWTAYGNSVMCDSFFEALNYYVWKGTGLYREPIIPNTIVARLDTVIPEHKEGGGPFKQSQLVINCYSQFLKEGTQSVIREMAQVLIAEIHAYQAALSKNVAVA
jgi:hypothetical protein